MIVDLYTSWRDFEESVPFKLVYRDYKITHSPNPEYTQQFMSFYSDKFGAACKEYGGFIYTPIEVNEWTAKPCCKRGNAEYVRQIKENFEPFTTKEPLIFFNTDLGSSVVTEPLECSEKNTVRFLKCVVDLDGDYDFFDENPGEENFIAYDDGFGNAVSDPEDEDFILYPIWDVVFEKGWTFDKAELEKQNFPVDDWLAWGVCEVIHNNHKRKRKRRRRTNMLYISGTTDPSICGFGLGWLEFGSHWNSFITNIKQQFGKKKCVRCGHMCWIKSKVCEKCGLSEFEFKNDIVYIRTWQSHENGHPHFHTLIYFKNTEFTAVRWYDDKGRLSWRLPSRAKLYKGDALTIRQRFKDAWKYGNVDVICVSDTQQAFKDMLKYVTRDLEGGESDLTNAMVWYFGKQSFSCSQSRKKCLTCGHVCGMNTKSCKHCGCIDFETTSLGFAEMVWGIDEGIDLAEPNDADLISPDSSNSNLELIRVEIFPILSADLVYEKSAVLPKTKEKYLFGIKDPPSESSKRQLNVDFIEKSVSDYVMVECKRSEKFNCPVYRYVRE